MLYAVGYTWLIFILALISGILAARYYIHMLQLSSYQFQGYFRTLRSKPGQYGCHVGVLIITFFHLVMITGGMSTPFYLDILLLLFLIFLAIQYRIRPAKKPLVYTPRVRRLIAVLVLIFIISFLIVFLWLSSLLSGFISLPGWHTPVYLSSLYICASLWAALMPLMTALGALIARPMEKAVNDHYIRDAKRILAEHEGLRIIGVTGSFGKTSMKYALTTFLAEGYRVLMTPGSYNTPMGVVRTIREQLLPIHEVFVCEMGARHVHDIRELCDIVNPDDGVITAIGEQHLETFHSLDNIIATKYELLDAVNEKNQKTGSTPGKMFVNIDSDVIRDNMKYPEAITYGISEDATYRATNITVTKNGTRFTVLAPGGEWQEIRMPLVGRHNVVNVTGAIAVAHSMGISLRKIALAAGRLSGVPHRLELSRHGNITILDDAYNSNPAGARAALEVLSLFTEKTDEDGITEEPLRILVTPGMVELGDKEYELNREFGSEAAAVCDWILTVGPGSKAIVEGAVSSGMDEDRVRVCHNRSEAAELMYSIEPGRCRVILLENDLPDNY